MLLHQDAASPSSSSTRALIFAKAHPARTRMRRRSSSSLLWALPSLEHISRRVSTRKLPTLAPLVLLSSQQRAPSIIDLGRSPVKQTRASSLFFLHEARHSRLMPRLFIQLHRFIQSLIACTEGEEGRGLRSRRQSKKRMCADVSSLRSPRLELPAVEEVRGLLLGSEKRGDRAGSDSVKHEVEHEGEGRCGKGRCGEA